MTKPSVLKMFASSLAIFPSVAPISKAHIPITHSAAVLPAKVAVVNSLKVIIRRAIA
jgi:hypothetical protein